MKQDGSGLEVGFNKSGAELVAKWAMGAKVCKAFNTTGSNNMADPVINGIRTVMFVCGDDQTANTGAWGGTSDLPFCVVARQADLANQPDGIKTPPMPPGS